MNNHLIATGRCQSHLKEHLGFQLHGEIISDFQKLTNAAKKDNIHIGVVSAYRSFERQQLIWNNKFNGIRPVYDEHSQLVDLSSLTTLERCHAIMKYSALPGASRHHFGSDLDIFDTNTVASDYNVQLMPFEYQDDGPFSLLNEWLYENAQRFGFFRPYQHDLGGIAVEPWHISHIEIGQSLLESANQDAIAEALFHSDVADKEEILNHLPELFDKYVINITQP